MSHHAAKIVTREQGRNAANHRPQDTATPPVCSMMLRDMIEAVRKKLQNLADLQADLERRAQIAKQKATKLEAEIKANIEKAQQEKLAKDQALNLEKQKQLEEKALKASIIQMIKQHKITDFAGDVAYQFIDENKIDEKNRTAVINQVVTGSSQSTSYCCGSARKLHDGAWLINWGGKFDQSRATLANGVSSTVLPSGVATRILVRPMNVFSYRVIPYYLNNEQLNRFREDLATREK